MKSKKTVIMIPSYEPDPRLIQLAKYFSEHEFDVLVINDGSNESFDNIFEEVKQYAEVEGYKFNRGKGEAMKYGYTIIKEDFPDADFIITCDGDGQHSPRDVERLYQKLRETNELVFGVRMFGKETPARSRFGNDVSKIIRSTLTKQFMVDDQCGLRGFPIRYLPDLIALQGSRYEYEMNQIVVFQLKHYKIIQMPIEVIYEVGNPTSHFKVFRDTGRIHHAIFKHAWMPIGFLCMELTMMYLLLIPNFSGYAIPHIWAYIFSVIPMWFFSLGVQSLMYPSKKFPSRLLREFIYFSIKLIVGILLLLILDEGLGMNIYGAFALTLFGTQLLNLFCSWLYHLFKRPGKLRRIENNK